MTELQSVVKQQMGLFVVCLCVVLVLVAHAFSDNSICEALNVPLSAVPCRQK